VRQVEAGEAPISDVEVSLHYHEMPSFIASPPAPPTPSAPPVVRTLTHADGTFAFRELQLREYEVRARLPTGTERFVSIDAVRAEEITRVRLVFGSAQVHGIVRATDGSPLAGIAVRIGGGASQEPATIGAWCFTNSQGEYRFTDLASAAYELSVGSRSSTPFVRKHGVLEQLEGWPSCKCRLNIVEGDDLTIDIGASEGAGYWHGALRTLSGDRYGADKIVTLARDWRTPRGSEVVVILTRTTRGVDGIDMHVPPGVWNPSVLFGEGDSWRSPSPLTIGNTDIREDLVVPGTRITGMVLDSATRAPLKSSNGAQHIRIRRFMRANDPDPDHEALVGADGRYTLLVSGAGDWVLTAEPLRLANGQKRLDVEIAAGEVIHHLDLEVREP